MNAEQAHRLAKINAETRHRKTFDLLESKILEGIECAIDEGEFFYECRFEGSLKQVTDELVTIFTKRGFDVVVTPGLYEFGNDERSTAFWIGWVKDDGKLPSLPAAKKPRVAKSAKRKRKASSPVTASSAQ